jgi:hypothetical protein
MKSSGVTVLLGLAAFALTGCGNTMRNYLERDTPTATASVAPIRQDLTMPPDLRLPPPGTTTALPDPGAIDTTAALTAQPPAATKVASAATATTATTAATAPVSGPDSVYVNAGIALNNPDGTRKSDPQLRRELQAYYLAQKQAKNPNYGTVFNIGNIFKDE